MAPERKNTAKLSLDSIAGIKGLFGTSIQAHAVLRLQHMGVPFRRFTLAMQHAWITQAEVSTIETLWTRWKLHFLHPEHAELTDFSLPDDLLLSRHSSNLFAEDESA